MTEKRGHIPAVALERTFVMVKPDGVERGLIGEIINRFERRGLKVIAMKMEKPSIEHVDNFYPKNEDWIHRLGGKGFKVFEEYGLDPAEHMGTKDQLEAGKKVREWLIKYIASAPVVPMVVEGVHAVDMVRKIVGATLPSKAELGTIRGDFSVDSPAAANLSGRAIKNLVHASETASEAQQEISHWFSEDELYEYERGEHYSMF